MTIKFSEAALSPFLDTYLSLTEATRYAAYWALLRGHVGGRVNLMADSPQVSECYGCAVEGRQLLQASLGRILSQSRYPRFEAP